MVIQLLLILVGVGLVTLGARGLVEAASSLAKRFKISDMVIGLTVVAFGTSAPELTVSVLASLHGTPDVAIGNVLGSNTMNICLILGISALITPLAVQRNTIFKEIPLSLLGVFVAFAMAFDVMIDGAATSVISRSDGWVLLSFFIIYLYYMLELARNNPEEVANLPDMHKFPVWLSVTMLLGGLVGLTFGGQMIVDNAVAIARSLGISEAIIGLTLVSVGTSIPELATSVVAAMRGKTDIAVGNVVGSNIFNTFLVLGVSATVTPLPLGNIQLTDFVICMAASFLLLVMCFWNTPRFIYRREGAILLALYVGYIVWLLF
ncbi:MAG: calcium/sodium antiporter [Lewinellaceae bacterium]|nr:calcium/sodium antiporter [Lewinellaceae bacterium]